MATVLFAAAGAAFGAGFGGTVVGLSGAVIGRAVGASLGRAIDQRLLGLGSGAVDVGRVDRLRIMGASEGTAIAKTWGRMRLAGQVIWASPFKETSVRSGGGKGAPTPRSTRFSYSVTLAIALCEGEILGIGRIWADGAEIEPSSLDLRVYKGSADQVPDPAIEAELGAGFAPAYRDTAYVVIENMDLSPFGNRVPQLNFEVIRQANTPDKPGYPDMIKAVALIPGTGEYALATEKVNVSSGFLGTSAVNENSRSGTSNFTASFDQLKTELPNCGMISLVVSWFGSDLRCGHCTVMPKVEQNLLDAVNMPWRSGGIGRDQAAVIAKQDDRSIYGGTPADTSVVQAIQAAHESSRKIMFYPFILMDQLPGNALPNPYAENQEQPNLPWRGRITLEKAPGQTGSSDMTALASDEVEAFFGTTQAQDFVIQGNAVVYTGLPTWTYRRFILHYAHLCSLAGGVEAFCIGSEMRGLTQIRGANHSFPAVAALRQLAADVRQILGPNTKISYAADWSEYFGYHTQGNVYFHLDPLWSDSNIDFIGIDNYMPLSDWRDGQSHADAVWGSNYDLDYLKSGILGGEGFDWYYEDDTSRSAQIRRKIEDGQYGEPWVFRYKDLPSWWGNLHHERIDNQRSSMPSDWIPQSKPIWFTEYGCAAVDKATNEPNKFVDPKSSESSLPYGSNGNSDEYIQFQYYLAMNDYWRSIEKNVESNLYSGRMLDLDRMFAWAWDARQFPEFPRNGLLWSDGRNYDTGHWLNGRASSVSIANLTSEVFQLSDMPVPNTQKLHGIVSGYMVDDVQSARAMLQPLSATFGFDVTDFQGDVSLISRGSAVTTRILLDEIALTSDLESSLEVTRLSKADLSDKLQLSYICSDGDFSVHVADSMFGESTEKSVSQSEYAIALSDSHAKAIVERWHAEMSVGVDTVKLQIPASFIGIHVGSNIEFLDTKYRVDRVEMSDSRLIECVRIEQSNYFSETRVSEPRIWSGYEGTSSVETIWMDLPLLKGIEDPVSPHVACVSQRWREGVGIWRGTDGNDYSLIHSISEPSIVGRTVSPLLPCRSGVLDRGAPLLVELREGELSSVSLLALLNGSNVIAIGDGTLDNWEVLQFQNATLIHPNLFSLSLRLRGQAGTDAQADNEWPVGSLIVVLDATISQVNVLPDQRGVLRSYRVGVASRGFGDQAVSQFDLSFKGNGLRPYRVGHLQAVALPNGDIDLRWIRRTRLAGDNWESTEVDLSESTEQYRVKIINISGVVVREITRNVPFFVYSAAEMTSDGTWPYSKFLVTQVSQQYGEGPSAAVEMLYGLQQ